LIEISQVSKRFGKVVALREVSCRIGAGERVAFVGSNGSGKTTLLRSLLGLLRVDGQIRIAGIDVARQPELALRQVAYIPQVAPPLDASVAEVVRAHASLRQITPAAVVARAERLGLSVASVEKLRFRDLSGGMRQKLLAALALASEACVLVCDEPTANLDAAARAAFFQQLAALPAERVVILCSHRAEEVEGFVGRVLEFAEGRLVRDKTGGARAECCESVPPSAPRIKGVAS
jgi:ABC-2 type transport system ATP-binding protein